jgi:hypothetical protein
MDSIEKRRTTDAANEQKNMFEAYGEAATPRAIEGTMLRFLKGDFLAGASAHAIEVALGARLVAVMDSLAIGWLRWDNSAPTDPRMGLVVDGFQPPRRSELGDLDKEMWERDSEGEPRDPWQFSNNLVLREIETGEVYTFVTSSKGGLGAIGELCKVHGKHIRQHPDDYPIVELDIGSYQHRDRSLGRIKYPIFKVVGSINKYEPTADKAPATEPPKSPPSGKPAVAAAKPTTTRKPAAQPQF